MLKIVELVTAGAILIVAVFFISLIFSLPTYWLWNWLMPDIFGLKEITWAQAWGLMIFSGMMFRPMNSSNKASN